MLTRCWATLRSMSQGQSVALCHKWLSIDFRYPLFATEVVQPYKVCKGLPPT